MEWREFLKPVNLVSLGIALIGIGLALYFGLGSQERTELSFLYNAVKVFDHNAGNSITVSDKNGHPVRQDIFAFRATIWNSGNVDLDPGKIRRPFTIHISGARFLDYAVSGATDLAVIAPSVDTPDDHTLTVRWQHLDPGNAIEIRFLFAGDGTSSLETNASILGMAAPLEGTPEGKITPLWERILVGVYGGMAVSVLILGGITFLLKRFGNLELREPFGIALIALVTLGSVALASIEFAPRLPPPLVSYPAGASARFPPG